MIRGRIDGTPAAVDGWARRFADREVHVAVEACTGWLFLCGALVAAGAVAHLAEPVETRALGVASGSPPAGCVLERVGVTQLVWAKRRRTPARAASRRNSVRTAAPDHGRPRSGRR